MDRRLGSDQALGLPVVKAAHIIEWLSSLGWCEQAGMGVRPLSSAELLAFAQLTGREFAAWELEAIRAGSSAFCQQQQSDDPREPTFDPESVDRSASPIRALAAALGAATRKD